MVLCARHCAEHVLHRLTLLGQAHTGWGFAPLFCLLSHNRLAELLLWLPGMACHSVALAEQVSGATGLKAWDSSHSTCPYLVVGNKAHGVWNWKHGSWSWCLWEGCVALPTSNI